MAFKIGEAFLRLFVDKSELTKGLNESKKDVDTFGSSVKEFAHDMAKELAGLAIGGSIVATIVETGKASIETAASMHELAQETGFTTEQLSQLGYAAGRSVEDFSGAIRTFNQQIVSANEHGGQAAASFRSVGVSADYLRSHSPYEVLMKVADAFGHSADGAGKVRIASELFGSRVGVQLIPTLNNGAAGLRKFADEADHLGATISGSTAEDAERFRSSIARLKDTIQGNLGGPLIAFLNGIVEAFSYVAYSADQITVAIIRDGRLIRDAVHFDFGEMKNDIKAYVAEHDALRKQHEEFIARLEKQAEVSKDTGDKTKNSITPIIFALEQANRQLDIQNAGLAAQLALLQHNAPASEELARQAERLTAAQLAENKIDPARVARNQQLQIELRLTGSIVAAEDQLIKSRLQNFSLAMQMSAEILKIRGTDMESAAAAAENEYELRQITFKNQRRDELKQAGDTIRDREQLAERLAEINANYDDLEYQNDQVLIAKRLELARQYGTSVAAVFNRLLHEQKAFGEEAVQTVENIKSAIETNLGDALFNGVLGHFKDVKDGFKSLAESILHEITNLMAKRVVAMFIEYLLGSSGESLPTGSAHFSGGTITTLGGANGGVFTGGFQAFADGGVVTKPTFGLVGEGDYNEAVIPLPDGRHVNAHVTGGGGAQINQVIQLVQSPNTPPMSDDQIITVVSADILRNGPIRRAIRARS